MPVDFSLYFYCTLPSHFFSMHQAVDEDLSNPGVLPKLLFITDQQNFTYPSPSEQVLKVSFLSQNRERQEKSDDTWWGQVNNFSFSWIGSIAEAVRGSLHPLGLTTMYPKLLFSSKGSWAPVQRKGRQPSHPSSSVQGRVKSLPCSGPQIMWEWRWLDHFLHL